MVFQINENTIKRFYTKKTRMKKIIKLYESDLLKIINKVLSEQGTGNPIPYTLDTITTIQTKLKSLGYNLGNFGPDKDGIDGKYGPLTKTAVKDFQRKNSLKPDGILNSPTLAKLGVTSLASQNIFNKTQSKYYNPPSESTGVDTSSRDTSFLSQQNFQKVAGEISPRSWYFFSKLKKEGKFKSDSWIIVNKDKAIAALFGPNYKFITNSFIATGRLKDPGVGQFGSHKDWWNISVDWAQKNPNNQEAKNIINFVKKYPTFDSLLSAKKINPKIEFPYSYTARKAVNKDFTPSGLFKLGSGFTSNYLVGGSGDPKGKIPGGNTYSYAGPAALHGYANKNRESVASEAQKKFVPFDISGTSGDSTRVGAGCINVDRQFLEKVGTYKPSWIIVLPDNGRDGDIKIVQASMFQKTLDYIESKGKEIGKSIWDFFN